MFSYSETAARWQRVTRRPTAPVELDALRLLTQNVWFGELCARERRDAILELIEAEQPDVVVLQEVTQGFLAGLLASEYVREQYSVSTESIAPTQAYDVVVLSALPARLTVTPFESVMGRSLFELRIDTTRGPVRVAGTHLESSADQRPTRIRQLDRALAEFAGAPDVVLLGDLNFECGTPEDERLVSAGFVDAWSALRPGEPGHTRDSERNAMVGRLGPPQRRRIDHVYVRGARVRLSSIDLCNTEAIVGLDRVWPSDHFGLLVEVELAG